ncbi:hypothetical protein L596_012152 [Steinernema carpocapsae]|uniref:Uncharacterized protein n=1 Tax=Steinernema carpocapsae TaxID=34508 RepID=A0A4U5NWZ8_STECR|nr:hypothetical protein L596_012152 [Steinernema carpocapsae]
MVSERRRLTLESAKRVSRRTFSATLRRSRRRISENGSVTLYTGSLPFPGSICFDRLDMGPEDLSLYLWIPNSTNLIKPTSVNSLKAFS